MKIYHSIIPGSSSRDLEEAAMLRNQWKRSKNDETGRLRKVAEKSCGQNRIELRNKQPDITRCLFPELFSPPDFILKKHLSGLMLRFHSVGMILYRGLFFLSPWCASGRCLSPVRSRKGRGVPPAAASSQLHTASFASCARSYVLGRWMDGQLGGLGIFWCICKRSLPLGKQHGNRESSIYIYMIDFPANHVSLPEGTNMYELHSWPIHV